MDVPHRQGAQVVRVTVVGIPTVRPWGGVHVPELGHRRVWLVDCVEADVCKPWVGRSDLFGEEELEAVDQEGRIITRNFGGLRERRNAAWVRGVREEIVGARVAPIARKPTADDALVAQRSQVVVPAPYVIRMSNICAKDVGIVRVVPAVGLAAWVCVVLGEAAAVSHGVGSLGLGSHPVVKSVLAWVADGPLLGGHTWQLFIPEIAQMLRVQADLVSTRSTHRTTRPCAQYIARAVGAVEVTHLPS